MSRLLSGVRDTLLLHLTRTGRERARRIRHDQTEAIVAANRIEVAGLLAGIGTYHLSLADITRQRATAHQPGMTRSGDQIIDALAGAIRTEIDSFAHRRREAAR